MKSYLQIISDFFYLVTTKLSPEKTLLLNFTTPHFLDLEFEDSVKINTEEDFKLIKDKKFDLIVGDLPVELFRIETDTVSKLSVNKNWSYILSALRSLSEKGKAFLIAEPMILFSQQGRKFLKDLSAEQYFLNSVFELPDKSFYPFTSIQPIIIGFEKVESAQLFIGKITSEFNQLLGNFIKREDSGQLTTGVSTARNRFTSFSQFRIESEINNLQTQYKDYTRYTLAEIGTINLTKTDFESKPNSVYIPKIGNSQVVSNMGQTTLKHQNYIQVVLDEKVVKADYLALFYRSQLGKLILKSLSSGSFIPNISKTDIGNSFVAIPGLEEQGLLILTSQKLSELRETINQLDAELSLNPKTAKTILDKYESIQKPLKKLSDEDLIYSLIRKGEDKHIEFKETFSKNTKTGLQDKEIEKASLKNIVGFLNADGGTLLIGICDNGKVSGIEVDFFQTSDKYKLHFKDILRSKIGSEFYSLIDYDVVAVSGKQVLKVECKKSGEPCFYDGKDFYVRTNPATDKLEGKQQHEYIRSHFSPNTHV